MSWILVRVDDRLIHGQVVVAWGGRMRPARIWVADDAIAASDWERDLLVSAAPDSEVRVTTIAAAAAAWATEAVATFDRLNLGGLHYAPGKTKVNEYVYLDEQDRTAARALAARGVVLEAQDVPAARPEALVALDPGSAAS